MPPKNIKTVRELIYWEYAKLIAGSAVGNRKNYGFVMHTFEQLKEQKIHPSTILKENKKLVEESNKCAYCGTEGDLHWEHIIPKSKGGPDTIDNMVQACSKCNLTKSDRDLYEWYGKEKQYDIPRLPLGKYLKLIYEEFDKKGTLDSEQIGNEGKLDVFHLGSVFSSV
ncbi:MAG: HNH endonuclease [Nitrososphaera sp.]|jgi:CRISPR/Cas system Type II protein with McrA/HNH and RuvC-like nuclease domain